MNTGFEFELLESELESIEELDMSLFGFDKGLEDDEIEIVEDEIPDIKDKENIKYGDLFQLGNHRLICGDSLDDEIVDKLLDGKTAKMLFTSPPYNMAANLYENYKDKKESNEYIEFNLNILKKWKEKLNGYIFWNISYNKNSRTEFIEIIYRILKESGMRFLELIVWDKGKAMPIRSDDMLTRQYEDILLMADESQMLEEIDFFYLGTNKERAIFNKKKGKGISNYWRIYVENNTQLENHGACFPVNLPATAITLTTDRNDIVLDCFGGSGSTLIACEQLNRNCYMCELDPVYVQVIIDRWEKFTGEKVVKFNG